MVQLPEPVNKFPEFVRSIVARLKALCPAMGKVKIAQALARAGLHLGATTVGRMLKPGPRTTTPTADREPTIEGHIVTARYPGHVWHVDLTVVPTGGFWTSWLPFALPQCWPFCYWVAIVVDHFSRRVMGTTAFKSQPTCEAVCGFLGRAIAKAQKAPRYIICDRGGQFDCDGFRKWCKRKGIKPPRYGARVKSARGNPPIPNGICGCPFVSARPSAAMSDAAATAYDLLPNHSGEAFLSLEDRSAAAVDCSPDGKRQSGQIGMVMSPFLRFSRTMP